jgi:negative regulator of sigma E activity/GTPase SAR1 family protein
MFRTQTAAQALAERMCRPQRVGIFGHRGVGKTTLLTTLYREAVAGRLPELRLAAADARTANYLSDKVLQLEAGQPLPATLAETDLRFHLYHKASRLELVVKDYQGEHVELGRQEPIRDFLRGCDIVLVCLDVSTLATPAERLRRQQEIEQLVEDYLAVEPQRGLHRPMALVLTKADLLDAAIDVDRLASEQFGMTRHALQMHCPLNGLFAVSCLQAVETEADTLTGGAAPRPTTYRLQPWGLVEPLAWLAAVLQAHDEKRMEWLWANAGAQLALMERAVACFADRYPDAAATAVYRQRLRQLRRRRWRNRVLAVAAAAASLLAAVWSYDALGYQNAAHFEAENGGQPAAVLRNWQAFQAWHPTRHLSRVDTPRQEDERQARLKEEIRRQQRDEQLAELRRRAKDADADPESVWRQFQEFRAGFPEVDVTGELEQLRGAIKGRRDEQVARRAQRAFDELVALEGRTSDPAALVGLADRFLRDFAGTAPESEVRRRRDAYLFRIQEHDMEAARLYSAKYPLNFQTRREHYQRYLDRHPSGAFAKEAAEALKRIDADWDRHDFRAVRDHFVARPGDIPQLVALCRSYLAIHPRGQFTDAARELLRWSERVTTPSEYRIVLRSGEFEHKIARFFSRGPDLSVEVEVNGVVYGPSNIIKNRYDPEWDYEFPRRVRWKLGDPVIIRVTDHDWWKRQVVEFRSEDNDPLAMRLLSGETWSGRNGIKFESDFTMPKLPRVE